MIKDRLIWLPIDGVMELVLVSFRGNTVYMQTENYPVYAMGTDFESVASQIISLTEDFLGVNDDRSD